MGMDGVDIVVEVEEAFGVALDDRACAQVVTAGDLCELVLSQVSRATADAACGPGPSTGPASHAVAAAALACGVDGWAARRPTRRPSGSPAGKRATAFAPP